MNERHTNGKMKDMRKITGYDPPLPVSIVKVPITTVLSVSAGTISID